MTEQQKAAMRMALECLKGVARGKYDGNADCVCAALEAALAEPEQSPEDAGYVPLSADGRRVFIDGVGEVPLAEPEQEPVAWMHPDGHVIRAITMRDAKRDGGAMLSSVVEYTIPLVRMDTPPARQPLTDDKIKAAVMDDPIFGTALMCMMRDTVMVADVRQVVVGIFRAAERAHGIGGNDE